MIQKSSVRDSPQAVSWSLTADTLVTSAASRQTRYSLHIPGTVGDTWDQAFGCPDNLPADKPKTGYNHASNAIITLMRSISGKRVRRSAPDGSDHPELLHSRFNSSFLVIADEERIMASEHRATSNLSSDAPYGTPSGRPWSQN
jgi:hypothetical protein